MIYIKEVVALIIAFSGGLIVAGAVSALVTSLGLFIRLSARTDTKDNINLYETVFCIGIIAAIFWYLILPNLVLCKVLEIALLGFIGFFMGCFVGCLAMSLAEVLDVSAVFFRRINYNSNIAWIIISLALGKIVGNLIYFFK